MDIFDGSNWIFWTLFWHIFSYKCLVLLSDCLWEHLTSELFRWDQIDRWIANMLLLDMNWMIARRTQLTSVCICRFDGYYNIICVYGWVFHLKCRSSCFQYWRAQVFFESWFYVEETLMERGGVYIRKDRVWCLRSKICKYIWVCDWVH